jgi:peptide/nickel transport system substrate-binding protein
MGHVFWKAALATLLLLAACTPTPSPTGGTTSVAPSPPGEQRADNQVIRVGVNGLPNNLTPQATTTFAHMFFPLYDSLTVLNDRFEPQPQLAERWDLSADGLTWRFFIRKDVKWPDGSSLTARDIAFTIKTTLEQNWANRTNVASVQEAVAVDDWTLELRTRIPDMAIVNNGIFIWVVPQKHFETVGFDAFVQNPIGSGPYEIVEYKAGDLVRYRKKASGHPFRQVAHDEIIFQALPQITTQVSGLRTGEIDFVTQVSYPTDQVETLKRAGLEVIATETANITFNFPKSTYEANNTPLKDKRVREALNYAVDKEAIAKVIFKGFNRAVGQYGTPRSPFWDDTVQPIPYDTARAKQMLAAAGYPNGFRLSIDVTPGFVPQDVLLAVQGNLRDAGVELDVNQLEVAPFLDRYFGRLPKADIFPLQSGESNGFFGSLRNAFSCTGPGGSPGLGFYCNPEFEQILAQAYSERDPAKRREIFLRANKVIREDFPGIFLVTQSSFTIYNSKIKGISLMTPNIYRFDSVYRVQ